MPGEGICSEVYLSGLTIVYPFGSQFFMTRQIPYVLLVGEFAPLGICLEPDSFPPPPPHLMGLRRRSNL